MVVVTGPPFAYYSLTVPNDLIHPIQAGGTALWSLLIGTHDRVMLNMKQGSGFTHFWRHATSLENVSKLGNNMLHGQFIPEPQT